MTDHEAELARLRAEADQAGAALGEMAGFLGTFYRDAIQAGFDPAQAFILTRDALRGMLLGIRGGDDE